MKVSCTTSSASVAEPVLLRVGAFESALHSWLMDWVRLLHEAQPGGLVGCQPIRQTRD
jgi:hypothetical protein